MVLSITGQAKDGDLVKGKVQTVGGVVIYNTGVGNYFATSESLKFKMFPQDKVPDDVIAACGALCTPSLPPCVPGP